MVTRIEAGHSPDQLFDQTRLAIKTHLLRSTLIPQKYKLEIADLLDRRTQMLDEVAFSAKAREASITSNAEDQEEQLVQQLVGVRAMHIPRGFAGDENSIVFRQRTVEELIDRPYTLMGGMLEEIAHAYYKKSDPEPLLSVPNHSLKIYPASTISMLKDTLGNHRSALNIPGEVNIDNVSITSSGHSNILQEYDPHADSLITYPVDHHQHAFEEARALMTQTLFASTIHGSMKKPFGSLREQLEFGIKDIINRAREGDNVEAKQIRGIQSLLPLFDNSSQLADTAKELVAKTYELDIDQFMDYMQRKNKKAFTNYLDLIDDFYIAATQ